MNFTNSELALIKDVFLKEVMEIEKACETTYGERFQGVLEDVERVWEKACEMYENKQGDDSNGL